VKPTSAVLMKRKEWAADGAKAWDEYLAAPAIAAAKTARLRQARLEKAAADKIAAEKAAGKKTASEKTAVEKTASERARLKSAPKTKEAPKRTGKTAMLRKIKLVATKDSA
jgi:hypothetical protein